MSGRDRIVLMAIGVLVVIAGGWMLVVSPERKKAKELDAQVSTAQSQLATAQSQLSDARSAQAKYAGAYSSVVALGKAVPISDEVPSLIYEISQASGQRHVQFNSIMSAAPGGGSSSSQSSSSTATAAATTAGFTQMPFSFVFQGGFFDLERLFRSLTSFTTRDSDGGLQVSGRLLTIQSVKLAPETSSNAKSTSLSGTISATAYVLPASSLTAGATATSPTGAATPASTTATGTTAAPAVVKVTP